VIVDNGGIVDNHCLSFLFTIALSLYDNSKQTSKI